MVTKGTEDYLEAILMEQQENIFVKKTNIANRLGISKPAVTKAFKELEDKGYISISDDKKIKLSIKGRTIAEKTYEKHQKIKEFLQKIGVSEKIANIDCCKIEHCISNETFLKIKEFCAK